MEDSPSESAQEHEKGKRSPDAAPSGVQVQLEKKQCIAWRMAAGYWKSRHSCQAACGCGALPGILTAPSPARLIPRGKLGISVWAKVILDRHPYLRPSNRLLQELACHGLNLSPGTVAGGLQRLLPLSEPLREALRGRQQLSEERWQADETGWRVFEATTSTPVAVRSGCGET